MVFIMFIFSLGTFEYYIYFAMILQAYEPFEYQETDIELICESLLKLLL